METTTLQPTSVTEQSKYYEFKEGTLTIDILKQLIPNSIMERYEIEFTESIYSQNGTFVIRTKDINKNIYNIGLKTIYEVKVQDEVCISLSSSNFNITIFEQINYISIITF